MPRSIPPHQCAGLVEKQTLGAQFQMGIPQGTIDDLAELEKLCRTRTKNWHTAGLPMKRQDRK